LIAYSQFTNECGRWPLIQPGVSQFGNDLESPQNCFVQNLEVSCALRRTYKPLGFKGLKIMSVLYSVCCVILTGDNC